MGGASTSRVKVSTTARHHAVRHFRQLYQGRCPWLSRRRTFMAEMNENPYESTRSSAMGAAGFTPRDDGSYRRTVRGAAWAGAKIGASIGAVLGAATDLTLVLIMSEVPPARTAVGRLAVGGMCAFFIVLPTVLGGVGGSFGFGFFAALNGLARRRRSKAEPSRQDALPTLHSRSAKTELPTPLVPNEPLFHRLPAAGPPTADRGAAGAEHERAGGADVGGGQFRGDRLICRVLHPVVG